MDTILYLYLTGLTLSLFFCKIVWEAVLEDSESSYYLPSKLIIAGVLTIIACLLWFLSLPAAYYYCWRKNV